MDDSELAREFLKMSRDKLVSRTTVLNMVGRKTEQVSIELICGIPSEPRQWAKVVYPYAAPVESIVSAREPPHITLAPIGEEQEYMESWIRGLTDPLMKQSKEHVAIYSSGEEVGALIMWDRRIVPHLHRFHMKLAHYVFYSDDHVKSNLIHTCYNRMEGLLLQALRF